MNRNQWLVVIGATGLAVGGCGGQDNKPKPNFDTGTTSDSSATTVRRHTVEGFLSDTGRTKVYDSSLVASLCRLETRTKGLDSTKRICPTGNPKDVFIPTYPPKE